MSMKEVEMTQFHRTGGFQVIGGSGREDTRVLASTATAVMCPAVSHRRCQLESQHCLGARQHGC